MNAIHDSSSLIEVDLIERVTGSVIVGIAKHCRVGNHDAGIVLLPERPLVRPSNAGPLGGGSNSLRWKARGLTEAKNTAPNQVSGLGISDEPYEVPTIGIEEAQA